MAAKKHEINMTEGPILKNLLRFAFPMILSTFLQHLYTATNTIVVGRWSGTTAMASVGASGQLTNLLVNFFIGITIGSTIIVSRKYGAGDKEGLNRALHTSVLFSVIIGIIACALGNIFCKPLLVLTGTPDGEVLDGAINYMRVIFLGKPATVIYNFCAAAHRATGDSKRPLYILVITGALNVLLNLLFVVKCSMGAVGAALATTISSYMNVLLIFIVMKSKNNPYIFNFSKLRLYKKELLDILKIGVPAGFQNTFLSLANTMIQSTVNSFGVAAIAGNAAAANIEGFVVGIKAAFRQATVTAVSQNYGAKNQKRIEASVRSAFLVMFIGCFVMSLVVVVFAKPLLSIYITDSPEAIYYGTIRLIVTGLPYFLSGFTEVTAGYLRGLGYSSLTTTNSFFGLCAFRILYVLFIFPLCPTFWVLFIGTPITWVLLSVMNIISIKMIKEKAIQKMLAA